MKYNFVVYKDGSYFNNTIELASEETIDNLFDKLQTLAYDTIPVRNTDVFMFTNKIGVAKFNLWLLEKFGDPVNDKWPVGSSFENGQQLISPFKSLNMYHMQPFGTVHVIEV
jgi:hypothetical protein